MVHVQSVHVFWPSPVQLLTELFLGLASPVRELCSYLMNEPVAEMIVVLVLGGWTLSSLLGQKPDESASKANAAFQCDVSGHAIFQSLFFVLPVTTIVVRPPREPEDESVSSDRPYVGVCCLNRGTLLLVQTSGQCPPVCDRFLVRAREVL